jgi:hypothetical protein
MPIRRLLLTVHVSLLLMLSVPGIASAQWYFAGYLGGNHTHDATVHIRVPSESLSIDFRDVQFAAEPTVPRRYYGLRIGKMIGDRRCFGLELEFVHVKALADVTRSYEVIVQPGSVLPPAGGKPMSSVVSEYQMTHGMNLSFVNLVFRQPLRSSDRVALMLRTGAGPSFPHAESTVLGQVRHAYEYGGFGAQGAAGIEIKLPRRFSILSEYKLTYARPTISLAQPDAIGWVHALTHHVVVGAGFALTK